MPRTVATKHDPLREFVARVEREVAAPEAQRISLLDFVHFATPRFERPSHLSPVADLIGRTRHSPIRAVVSGPPRHGKTELFHHAIPWRLRENPTIRVGYATYGQRFSERRSARMRGIASEVGVPIDGESSSKANWRTGRDDGGVWATSVGGPITGEGFDLLVIDDPVKDRATAESAIERDKLWDWFTDVAFTRLEPGGSCIVFMARWHEDDLAGRLVKDGWPYLVLPAIDDDGQALWPGRWPAEKLNEIRETIGEYAWASLYQGVPLPKGGALFKDVRFYDALPQQFRIGKGIDLAVTAKTRADASAAVVMLESGGLYYVVDVRTARVKVPDFIQVMLGIDKEYPGQWHWYTSSTETGTADLATATAGVHILPERAAVDKFQRAQGVAAAWNAGRVLLPRKAPWLDAFVSEVCGFTGAGDRHDDQVDALASAFQQAGGVFAMRDRGGKSKVDFWENLDRAMAVKPLDDSSRTPAEVAERWAAEEKRMIAADERAARKKQSTASESWWKQSPFASGRERGKFPKSPF